ERNAYCTFAHLITMLTAVGIYSCVCRGLSIGREQLSLGKCIQAILANLLFVILDCRDTASHVLETRRPNSKIVHSCSRLKLVSLIVLVTLNLGHELTVKFAFGPSREKTECTNRECGSTRSI